MVFFELGGVGDDGVAGFVASDEVFFALKFVEGVAEGFAFAGFEVELFGDLGGAEGLAGFAEGGDYFGGEAGAGGLFGEVGRFLGGGFGCFFTRRA